MTMPVLDRLTIVIVTFDGDDLLSSCLDSILNVYSRLPETVVVDNADKASTAKLVRSYGNVRYVASPGNPGFAGGNNIAMPYCTKEYILLLNNDTKLQADSLTPLVAFMDKHPRCGEAQGCTALGTRPGLAEGCGMMLTTWGLLNHPYELTPLSSVERLPAFKVFAGGGMFLLLRKSAIDSIGGLPFCDLFGCYYEDVDLGRRLWLCGWEAWYCPTPPVVHFRNLTSKRMNRFRIAAQEKTNVWYSLLTCHQFTGLARFAIPLLFAQVAKGFLRLLVLDTSTIRSNLFVLRKLSANWRRLRSERRAFQSRRVLTDKDFLKTVIALPVPPVTDPSSTSSSPSRQPPTP